MGWTRAAYFKDGFLVSAATVLDVLLRCLLSFNLICDLSFTCIFKIL